MGRHEVTMILTFDLPPPKSNQFTLVQVNICTQFEETPEMWQEWDVPTWTENMRTSPATADIVLENAIILKLLRYMEQHWVIT